VRIGILACLLFTTGCYSFTTLSRAHTVGKGHVEVFAAPEAIVVPAAKDVSIRPVGEVGARVGVTSDLDLEGRVTTLGGALAAHVQLRRDPTKWGVDAMLSPGVQFTTPDKLAFELPLVLGVDVGHDDQIVVAPRFAYQLRFGVPGFSHPIGFAFAGGSLGFAWRLAKHFTLMPEASFLAQIYAQPGFASNVAGTVGTELALGALFDF